MKMWLVEVDLAREMVTLGPIPLYQRGGQVDALRGISFAPFERSPRGRSTKGTRGVQQAVRLARLGSPDLRVAYLCPLPQSYVKDQVCEHVAFIQLRFSLNLSLKIARRDQKLL